MVVGGRRSADQDARGRDARSGGVFRQAMSIASDAIVEDAIVQVGYILYAVAGRRRGSCVSYRKQTLT